MAAFKEFEDTVLKEISHRPDYKEYLNAVEDFCSRRDITDTDVLLDMTRALNVSINNMGGATRNASDSEHPTDKSLLPIWEDFVEVLQDKKSQRYAKPTDKHLAEVADLPESSLPVDIGFRARGYQIAVMFAVNELKMQGKPQEIFSKVRSIMREHAPLLNWARITLEETQYDGGSTGLVYNCLLYVTDIIKMQPGVSSTQIAKLVATDFYRDKVKHLNYTLGNAPTEEEIFSPYLDPIMELAEERRHAADVKQGFFSRFKKLPDAPLTDASLHDEVYGLLRDKLEEVYDQEAEAVSDMLEQDYETEEKLVLT